MSRINSNITQADFAKYAEWFFKEKVMPILQEKGRQYSNGRAFTNFEEGSKLHDVTPGSYLMIMATKHWHNLCKKPDIEQEERIRDIIIYMLLLQAMYGADVLVAPEEPVVIPIYNLDDAYLRQVRGNPAEE
jgi:hypothetical protein